jgi:gliding motility-associated-like protein
LVLPPLDISLTTNDDLCRQGVGSVSVNATGGFPTKTYSLDGINFVSSNTFNNLLPGDYTVYVNAGSNCIGQLNFTIAGPDEALSITQLDQTNPSCGLENGIVTFEVAGGTPGYTFTLNGSPITPQLSGNTYTIDGLYDAPTHIIEVIDSNNCNATFTTPAFDPIPIPTFDVTDAVICPGETAILNVQTIELSNATNLSYSWRDGNGNPLSDGNGISYLANPTTGELQITGLSENVNPYEFQVIVSGVNLCNSDPIPATVTVNPVPKILEAQPVNILCFGEATGSITFIPEDATAGADYEYRLNGGPWQGAVFNNLTAGTYSPEVRNTITGCTTSLPDVTLTEPAEVLFDFDEVIQPACGEANGLIRVDFSGGVGPYQVELFQNGSSIRTESNASSPLEFRDLAPGDYEIRLTDDNGCPHTLNQQLINDVGIQISVDPMSDEICAGDVATILPVITTAGNPELTWYKNPNQQNPITTNATPDPDGLTFVVDPSTMQLEVTGLQPGTYTYYLVAEGPGYCPNPPFEANITVLEPITATLAIENEGCFGAADGSIEVAASGSDGNFEYSINGGANWQSNTLFTDLSPGTYTIDIRSTGGNDCTFSLQGEVEGAAGPISINSPTIERSFCDQANGVISNLTISGGWAPYQVEWRKGRETGPIISGDETGAANLLPDTYFVIITDSEDCSEIFNFTIEEMPDPDFLVAPVDICGGEDVILNPVNIVSGSAPSDLLWYKDAGLTQQITAGTDADNPNIEYEIDNDGNLTITNLPSAENPLTFYLEVVCTGQIIPVEVLVRVVPEPVFETDPEVCFGAADGKIRVVSGGLSAYTYSIDGGAEMTQTELEALSFSPNTYSIEVKNGPLCPQIFNLTVAGPQAPIGINNPDIIRSTCGLSNGSIENLQISGGWGNYAVEWRQGSETGPVVSTDPTQAIDLAPDTYFLLITDAEGCLFVDSFVLEEQPRPNYVIAPVEICASEEVILTPVNTVSGSSGSELVWYKDASRTQEISNGPDAIDPSISYSIDTDGTLTITGLEGDRDPYIYYLHVVCNDENVYVEALVRTVPALDFETDPEQCFGAEDGKIRIIAGADPLYEYSISGNNLTQAELEAAEYAPGTYTISVSNEGFCLQDFTVVVEGPDTPLEVDPLTQIDPGCGADIGVISTEVSGGWAPYEVTLFRDGSAIETSTFQGPEVEFDDLAPGDYYLTVTDAEGCLETSNTVTLVYGPTQIIIDDVGICEGEDAVLIPSINPSAPNPTYSWFKDAAATIPIVSDPNPDANGHIFQIAANGTLTISGLDASDSPQTYYATVSGTDVCPGFIGSAQVVINRIPSLSYAVSNEVCFGDNGTINLQGSDGDGTFEYSLNGNDWQSSGTFDVAPGIYTGYVRSGAGCIVSNPNIEVQGPSAPLSYSEPTLIDPTCNTADGSISFTISGGYGNYSVEVTKDGSSFGTFASPSGQVDLQDLESGSYSFLILDENPDGINCQLSIPAQIELEDLPTPLSASGVEICEGETASIQASTTQTGISPVFTWYQNANGTGEINTGTSGSVSYQVNSSSGELSISGLSGQSDPYVYYVGISGNGVCEPELVPVEVFVYPIPNLRVSNPSIVCDPQGTVDLTQFIEGFNPNLYDYNIIDPTGGSMRMDEIDAVNLSGSYQVSTSLRGADCWSPEQRIQVIISDTELVPEFNYEVDLGGGNILTNAEVQIQEPVQFQDVSLGKVIIWNWDFGDGSTSSAQNPSHEYQKKGSYTVTLTTIDEFGCVAEYQRVIQVFDDYVIIVPNAFTPDGNKNQYFKPQYRGIASMEFYVFNTWGELIFEANSLETMGWDGTLNGKKVPNGNYVYRAVFTTRSGEKEERSGVFVLIR